jgi:type II secretory pathway predicted ATPase ExeA/pSer/pThr/pTyr-binding forkhead associated (FHA) protein
MNLTDTGLHTQPFQPHGKPIVLVPYASHKDGIRFLNETRFNDHGLGLFHGPSLSGKTSVIRQFRKLLADKCAIAVTDTAGEGVERLLQDILEQFGYDRGFNSTSERIGMVRVFAMQQAASARAPMLIIENAHAMSPTELELLCEFAELKVREESALRIVLASDRSIRPMMQAAAMEPVSRRVTGQFLMQPLARKETAWYIYKKLASAGCANPRGLVPPAVCDRLHDAAAGWPGMIDRLAMTALANAERIPLQVTDVPQQRAPSPEPERRATAVPQLILTHRRRTLKRVRLDKVPLLIGRNELCDLRVAGEWISRHHAVLLRKAGTTVIVDLKSRNGTYVNGKRVSKQVLICNDIISIGDHRIKFVDPAAQSRTSLQDAGWDETTITKSIRNFRHTLAKQLQVMSAG